ncbi:histidine kinase [Actinoplanes sp. NPDC026619]|uniref:sensor histidine kinase n=1 Tax=Actinoplanes sp. NPDC026619 TaxID=3155798 RepID=UPI0033C53E96
MADDPVRRPFTLAQLILVDAVVAAGYLLFAGADHRFLLAATILPVAVRRLWPVPVFALVLTLSLLTATFAGSTMYLVGAAYALYLVAVTQPPRRLLPTAVVGGLAGVGVFVASVVGAPTAAMAGFSVVVGNVVLLGGAWWLGRVARERRAYTERAEAAAVQRALTDERLRIAREMHDIVAHSMGVIAVKAGVAHHVMREHPGAAYEALGVIETTSRAALGELRQLLDVLRPAADAADLVPLPGLADIAALADRAAPAGVQVDLRVDATVPLPPGVELSAYRIVQEALTNVVKHAAPAACRVRVFVDGAVLAVHVTDDGPGRALPGRALPGRPLLGAATAGHGLAGMRERVAVHGGRFHAGPSPLGGFAVYADLPFQPLPASSSLVAS